MTIKRRELLSTGVASLAVLGLPSAGFAQREPLAGYLYGVSTLNPENMMEELSVVVRMSLADGKVTYHPLPEHKLGHSLTPLPDGGFFAVPYGDDATACLFLDADLNVQDQFAAPDGYGFGGHAALLPDGRHIFGHFNQAGYAKDKRRPDQTGQRFVVDVQARKTISVSDTEILHGHDIILSRDGRHVIVGDDGTLEVKSPEELKEASEDPYALVAHSPSLTLFNADTFEHEKTIPLGINGSFVHIEQDGEGVVFGAVEQYVSRNEAGLGALRQLLGDDGDVERYVDSLAEEVFFVELPYPGPLMRVDLDSGGLDEHLAPQNQAPFDIKLNTRTNRMFNVFTASNMLARFDPRKKTWGYFSTAAWGIEQPYGLIDIPGTTLMAVNGFLRGIAVFDTLTMSLVRFYTSENFGIKHLLYQP